MTNREFLTAIINNTTIPADLREFASESIEKLNARNAARSAKPSKAAVANEALAEALRSKMEQGEVYTAAMIAEMLDLHTESGMLSTSKATAVAKVLVEAGLASAGEVKIPKKGKCKGYTLVADGEDE